jgi:hypothetical protein
LSSFMLIKDINEENIYNKNIINYVIKNGYLFIFFIHMNKMDDTLINYFMQYSKLTHKSISYFNNCYDIYNNNMIIKMLHIKILQ